MFSVDLLNSFSNRKSYMPRTNQLLNILIGMTNNIRLRLFGPVPWYWFKIQNKKICSADVRSNKHEENE